MKRPLRTTALILALLALQTALPGCFGRWALTRKVYGFNESIGDKWLRSILTFVMVVVPVYGVCAFVDWVVFNTIEFWGGTNPVDGAPADQSAPLTHITTANDGSAIKLQLSPDGSELRVEVAKAGELPKVLILSMRGDGAELRDGAGSLISSLARDASGDATVRSAGGALLAQTSAGDVSTLEEALRSGGQALFAQLEMQSGLKIASAARH